MRYSITHMNCLKFIFPYVLFLFVFKKQNKKNMAPLTGIQLLMSLNSHFVISTSLVITRITSLLQHHDFSGTTMTDEKMTRKERALLLCCLLSDSRTICSCSESSGNQEALRVPDTSSTSQTGCTEISPGFEMESGTGAGVELGGKKSEAGAGAESWGGGGSELRAGVESGAKSESGAESWVKSESE